jgi:cyclophilin family peptidyl-prolyl cis-trans isomerase
MCGCRLIVLLLCSFFVADTQGGMLAQFRIIPFGEIDVELFDKDKPLTVNNFIHYVQSGRYKDSFFHRCDPTTLVEGGTHYVVNHGNPGQTLGDILSFGTIPNEYGSGTIYSNRYGTIAMDRLPGQTNSATSAWFFNLKDNAAFDARTTNGYFTVFGRIVGGTNLLNMFRGFTPWTGGQNETNVIANLSNDPYNFGQDYDQVPLLRGLVAYPSLIYIDISLLNVQIRKDNDAREISWNSVTGKVNRVEYTTSLPPVWNTLLQTNPITPTMSVQDFSIEAGRRFYRVVVNY